MSITQYINTLDSVYRAGTNNHPEHNSNPLYWDVLLKDIKYTPDRWEGKTALDFGCGKGRNVTNMKTLANFARVDGVDISENNIRYCRASIPVKSTFYQNNGTDLSDIPDSTYDFVMSTIVFQHLCLHELRYALKTEIYRVMKPGGIFSFQMGYGDLSFVGHGKVHSYYENVYHARGSNGSEDVRVTEPSQLVNDLTSIGFKNVEYRIEQPWEDGGHPNWIYVRCEK